MKETAYLNFGHQNESFLFFQINVQMKVIILQKCVHYIIRAVFFSRFHFGIYFSLSFLYSVFLFVFFFDYYLSFLGTIWNLPCLSYICIETCNLEIDISVNILCNKSICGVVINAQVTL